MELDLRGYQQFVADDSGQSSAEYAIVLGAVLCIVVALGLLGQTLDSGLFVEHALAAATHHVQTSLSWAADIFSF